MWQFYLQHPVVAAENPNSYQLKVQQIYVQFLQISTNQL